MKEAEKRLPLLRKGAVTVHTLGLFVRIAVDAKRRPLPKVVDRLKHPRRLSSTHADPRRLGRIVSSVLHIGPWHARCLYASLVLFRLLQEQGDRPELVIGLPREPKDKDAHAWVEIDGVDVGPPPGGYRHEELTRYG
jgi:hypothetical protein